MFSSGKLIHSGFLSPAVTKLSKKPLPTASLTLSRALPVHVLNPSHSLKTIPVKTSGLNIGDSITLFIIFLSYVAVLS